MLELLADQLRRCAEVQSVLDCVLDQTLQLSHADFGNIQLMNWKAGYLEIKAQRGFREEFMNFFARVKLEGGSACARALRSRESVIIEDVMVDPQFLPYLDIVRHAGVRAVQSTPLMSSSGALVGILSTHFPTRHRPSDLQMSVMKEVAQLAANAIIRFRANARALGEFGSDNETNHMPNRSNCRFDRMADRLLSSRNLLIESRETIARAEKPLSRGPLRGNS